MEFETTTQMRDDDMLTVVTLTEAGLSRVLDGQVGMTFVVDHFTESPRGYVAHVIDYRHAKQIWSLAPDQFTVIISVGV